MQTLGHGLHNLAGGHKVERETETGACRVSRGYIILLLAYAVWHDDLDARSSRRHGPS